MGTKIVNSQYYCIFIYYIYLFINYLHQISIFITYSNSRSAPGNRSDANMEQ